MRRTFVIAVVVAMLLCPLVVVCDGSGAEAEELPKAPLRFDEEEIKIYDDFNELKHDGDILEVLDLIRIVPVKENVNVIINGEKTTAINVLYAIPKKYFENEIRIETIITGELFLLN